MGDASNNGEAKITLYTAHRCPWAHRAHIVLKEMGLDYDEVFIDLMTPREDWFLKINPRGLVPTMKFDHPSLPKPEIIIESGLVVHFLLDTYPHLAQKIWPAPVDVETAHLRYRMSYFIDTFFSKVQSHFYKMMFAHGTDQAEERIDEFVAAVREHVEPLLEDAKPFFGGSQSMTLVEVQTGSFILRAYDYADGKLISESLREKMDELPNFSRWAHATKSKESVTYIWDKDHQLKLALESMPKLKAKFEAAQSKK